MRGAVYDGVLSWPERRGLRALRAEVASSARGRTLEIGAGTGLTVRHYGATVTQLVAAEPERAFHGRLERRLAAAAASGRVVEARAEALPFADGSFDTVVSTLVLCTVDDPARAVAEIKRVLAPGGQLLFVEHIHAAAGTRRAAWQDRLARPWRAVAGGCRCNRPTLELVQAGGFETDAREASRSGLPPLLRPVLVGRAHT